MAGAAAGYGDRLYLVPARLVPARLGSGLVGPGPSDPVAASTIGQPTAVMAGAGSYL